MLELHCGLDFRDLAWLYCLVSEYADEEQDSGYWSSGVCCHVSFFVGGCLLQVKRPV